jgi:hypothetical protein
MKTFIKLILLLAVSFCLYGCSDNSGEKTEEYYVKYRVYYTNTDIKTETFRTELPENKRGYDLHLDSYRGSNSIDITSHNSIGVAVRVISTTAPIEIIEHSNNFVKTYGVSSKLQ